MDRLESEIKRIREQKEKIIKDQPKILSLKTKISDLKIHRNVAIYAYFMDKILIEEEIHSYLDIAKKLKDDENVQKYIKLKKQLDSLEQEKIDYYKEIQTKLKDQINRKKEATAFVYYGRDEDNHIITRDITSSQLSLLDLDEQVILPFKELESKRKIRHFYNRVSFKYLEELTKDNDFSLNNKNLGRVKVKKKL